MTTVAIEVAQRSLSKLVEDVRMGAHIVITRNDEPVAELVPVPDLKAKPVFGSARGLIQMAEDFDDPLTGIHLTEC